MEAEALLKIIANGEDSSHQFKADIHHAASLGAEMVAFSNTQGGLLLIGVNDDGSFSGLTQNDVSRLNQLISNAASSNIRPPIAPTTENITYADGMVIVLSIEKGLSKPYMDAQGQVWVKKGADKRKVSAPEELRRMLQSTALIHADEMPVKGSSVADIDAAFFEAFFEKHVGESFATQTLSLTQLMTNMNLMKEGQLNICAVLLFATKPQLRLPAFMVKAVAFLGVEITDEHYLDSQDLTGKLSEVFQKTLGFVLSNIRHVQGDQGINSLGEPEVPRIALEELIANALMHRDYFISAPVRVLVFADRIEMISPGHLPNNLTVENIKLGNSNIRNPILASFATRVLPYRGLGSGILRAFKAHPHIELIDDTVGNQFKVIIKRRGAQTNR